MINFKKLPESKNFYKKCWPYLQGAIERLFGGTVSLDDSPIDTLKGKYGIDFDLFPKRGVYILNAQSAVILGRVLEERELKAVLTLKITNSSFSGLESFLNDFEGALANALSQAYTIGFDMTCSPRLVR